MENNVLTGIGQRMAEIRRLHNTTQEQLADMLDVSPKHISHCENETSCLSLKNLVKFCHLFGCSLDYLVLGCPHDSALSKFPDGIIKIMQTGNDKEIERLNRYLQFYLELLSSFTHN